MSELTLWTVGIVWVDKQEYQHRLEVKDVVNLETDQDAMAMFIKNGKVGTCSNVRSAIVKRQA